MGKQQRRTRTFGHRAIGLAAAALVAGTLGAVPPAGADDASADDSRTDIAAEAVRALQARPGAARATERQEFDVVATVVDADGSTHVRMNRTVHGLPVVGGDLVVHRGAEEQWQGVSQTLRAPLDLSVEPGIGKAKARTAALAPSHATRAIDRLRTKGAPRLVVDALAEQARLAWEVPTAGRHEDGTPSRLLTYVDARTGEVIRRDERIRTTDGTGHSLYSGTVPISVQPSGSSYRLTDVAHGGAATTDMQNREDSFLCTLLGVGCTNGVAFTSPDTVFGDSTNADRASAAVDAHYGGAVTFDYFKDVHGRNGIFGDGTGAPSRVHYGDGYVNAFWDGEKMTYGDGDGADFGPLVSLDVSGHEMSHGVTEHTANLTYSGEPGGLNEATSDIFGSMVEFHAGNPADPGDYFVGEQFDLADHDGFRRMDAPAKDGSSLSCWTPNAGNADVHHSSGIGNHFFYLLAEGSGTKTIGGKVHTSPTCDGSTVTGIGREAAAAVWFRALDVYMTSGTDYAGARAATLDAAGDLYGEGSAEQQAVAAAWTAVAVG